MLLALSLPLPKVLLTHAHWTMNQKKMSKSLGNVADPIEAMNVFGVDGVRYYMARVGGRFRDDVGEPCCLVFGWYNEG
jgi:methionyl-tRNA synthetase